MRSSTAEQLRLPLLLCVDALILNSARPVGLTTARGDCPIIALRACVHVHRGWVQPASDPNDAYLLLSTVPTDQIKSVSRVERFR